MKLNLLKLHISSKKITSLALDQLLSKLFCFYLLKFCKTDCNCPAKIDGETRNYSFAEIDGETRNYNFAEIDGETRNHSFAEIDRETRNYSFAKID